MGVGEFAPFVERGYPVVLGCSAQYLHFELDTCES